MPSSRICRCQFSLNRPLDLDLTPYGEYMSHTYEHSTMKLSAWLKWTCRPGGQSRSRRPDAPPAWGSGRRGCGASRGSLAIQRLLLPRSTMTVGWPSSVAEELRRKLRRTLPGGVALCARAKRVRATWCTEERCLVGRTIVGDDQSLEFELEPTSNGGGRSELRREICAAWRRKNWGF
jgi:hypothetical protein